MTRAQFVNENIWFPIWEAFYKAMSKQIFPCELTELMCKQCKAKNESAQCEEPYNKFHVTWMIYRALPNYCALLRSQYIE